MGLIEDDGYEYPHGVSYLLYSVLLFFWAFVTAHLDYAGSFLCLYRQYVFHLYPLIDPGPYILKNFLFAKLYRERVVHSRVLDQRLIFAF